MIFIILNDAIQERFSCFVNSETDQQDQQSVFENQKLKIMNQDAEPAIHQYRQTLLDGLMIIPGRTQTS
jgi:hypothetical protein